MMPKTRDHDDFGLDQSKIIGVIHSENHLQGSSTPPTGAFAHRSGLGDETTMPPHGVRAASILAALDRCMGFCNRIIVICAALALIAACIVLSHSMLTRSLFRTPTYWQDEAAVFLLVGATFMTAAYVQSRRGHIGIEALVGLLSPRVNHVRQILIDVISFVFCGFFAWKSWTLTHEAWIDGQVSNSMWSPPLAIPYAFMSFGMTLLCIQIFLQIWGAFYRIPRS